MQNLRVLNKYHFINWFLITARFFVFSVRPKQRGSNTHFRAQISEYFLESFIKYKIHKPFLLFNNRRLLNFCSKITSIISSDNGLTSKHFFVLKIFSLFLEKSSRILFLIFLLTFHRQHVHQGEGIVGEKLWVHTFNFDRRF